MRLTQEDFFIGGDLHYFRVERKDWPERLRQLKEAGASYVSTYIPWMLHEPEERSFHFSDTDKNDLEGFLSLCRELDIKVIAKPGPYQYSELRYCGLPVWLCENHPEIMAQDKNGVAYNGFAVSYLHPTFLEKVEHWYEAVLPILAKHCVSRGGAIHAIQVDNELCFHEWFGGWDYHRDVMGWGLENGPWASYQAEHPHSPYHDFYFLQAGKYLEVLASWIRKAGIDCSLVHNAANPNMVSYFKDAAKLLGPDFLLGVDMYYNLGMDFEANNPTPKFASNAFLGFEQLRLLGFVPTVLEMQAGNCADWPPIIPENLRCWYMTCLAMGMKGINWYVFAGGSNPPGIGGDGDIYDYCAPIGPKGEVRKSFSILREFSEFVKENSWLQDSKIDNDYYLGLDWAQPRGKNEPSHDFGNADAWELLRKGVLITGLCSSRVPELADLSKTNWMSLNGKPLVVCSSSQMARGIQKNIVAFLQKGGQVLLLPILPQLDENGLPCTILLDFLRASPSEKLTGIVDFCMGDLTNIAIQEAFCSQAPEGSIIFATDKFSNQCTGWELKIPGGGKLTWFGLAWKHSKHIHETMMERLLQRVGAQEAVVKTDNPNVWVILRTNGKKRCLFFLNLFATPATVNYKIYGHDWEPCVAEIKPMETEVVMLGEKK